MPIDASPQIAPGEGTALPAPRPFGETSTLTLPRARHRSPIQSMLAQAVSAAPPADARSSTRVSVVAANPTALTITF